MQAHFRKMNGAGNDFVVFDARQGLLSLSAEQLQQLASRGNPATRGCDQVIVMERPRAGDADVFMRIFNADGSEVDACGNATRCIAWLLMREAGRDRILVQTHAGILHCSKGGMEQITVDMGEPRFTWEEIPLSGPCNDTLRLDLGVEGLPDAASVGMGNPHVIFFTTDEKMLQRIEQIGPQLQHHLLFKKHGVNVTIAHAKGAEIACRVFERGVGITQACGTAACASVVAAVKRGLCGRNEDIRVMQGGEPLTVRWVMGNYGSTANNHVFLTGPVEDEFTGAIDL